MLMARLGDLAETQRHALPGVFDSLALMLSFSICEAWLVDTTEGISSCSETHRDEAWGARVWLEAKWGIIDREGMHTQLAQDRTPCSIWSCLEAPSTTGSIEICCIKGERTRPGWT